MKETKPEPRRIILASSNDYATAAGLLSQWRGRGYICEIEPITLRSQVIYEIVEDATAAAQ